jgi:hypothetical protein
VVVDEAQRMGAGLQVVRRWRVLDELKHLDVKLLPGVADIAIGERTVSYLNNFGQRRTIAADQVIIAKGAQGDHRLADMLRDAAFPVRSIGDANGVGYIEGAMQDAADVAIAIG